MSARESLIGAGLAVVLVVGIVDAAAGHDDSSKPAATTIPATESPQTSVPTSAAPTPTPTTSSGRKHHGGDGMDATSSATPTNAASSAAPTESTAPTPTATDSAAAVPAGVLGTFTYATTGSEETNIPGTHRDFPKTTKIVNKLEGCGISSTWKPIAEHVQKQVLCPGGDGVKVKSYETTISFYGVTSGENFTCSGPSYIYREGVKAGDTWSFKCKSPDAVAAQTSRAVGFETVNVGGTSVRALHVHVETKLQGEDAGTSTQDYWIATKQPVLVKETGQVTAQQGNVHYSSTYSLALKSLSPKT